ncbi:hypothetical protein SD70_08960 [Gordoniibacillus kamchatkensis]|uniref:Helicase XPB/Ssl2 N-terminal domain-containing protein n=1 Tax=Gordoniibacillus kamchatkensis TaxID=1590651 RepID=A0ABR5AJY1_9BACL|nr:helicase-associated domain-containing protein [Paenibacillus sp. VKM B-2647]KIL41153.1 hypothetical protein SD70_08960 [Paenibacillus sp. VKM B-2647]
MMVREALRKLPPRAQQQLERHPLLRKMRGDAPLASLERLYATQEGVRALLGKLSGPERITIMAVVSHFANMPFDEAALVKRAGGEAPGLSLRIGLAGLCAAGIIVPVRKAWGERLYTLPYDALGAWQSVLFGELEADIPGESVELTTSCYGCLDDDLFALLTYAAKQELALTKAGAIHKRHMQALRGLLQTAGSEPLQRLGLAYDHSDVYDAGTAIMLDAALRLALLAPDGGALRLAPERLRAWLRLPRSRRLAALRAALLSRLWPGDALGQHAAAAALHAPRGAWLALPRLAAWLASGAGTDAPLAERTALSWLEPLAALGWLELGRSVPTGQLAFRVPAEDAAAASGCFYVQPDFEIVVPPDVPAAVRWELGCCAEHAATDQVYTYRITKESIQFGCENGWTADAIETFMETYGMYELPDNVRQAIRHWAASSGRGSLARPPSPRCESGETASRRAYEYPGVLEMDTEIGPFNQRGTGAYTECDAIPDTFAPDAAEVGKGLLQTSDPLFGCELEPELPEVSDALPDLRRIPDAWWKDYRGYHASTRKQLIRTAIEWQSLLRLRTGGQERTVAPQRLLEERDGWCFIGLEQGSEIRIRGDAWDDMKLIVPGVND